MSGYLRSLAPAVALPDRTDVEYVCPECSGQLTTAAGLVVYCAACDGTGRMTGDRYHEHARQQRARVAAGLPA